MTAKQVVLGYDGSHASRVALTWAVQSALVRRVPLLIAYAASAPHGEPEGLLGEAASRARSEAPGLPVRTTVVPGPAVASLLELLADAQLGVVGCRGLGTVAELLVGSTSLQVAVRAPCPVVVVRSSYFCEPGADAGRVVVGVDGSEIAATAIAFAFEEAALRGCGLVAVYAWDLPRFDGDGRPPQITQRMVADEERGARRTLTGWLAGWTEKYPEVDVRARPVRDDPVPALVAASAGAEVVVVGTHGARGFRSLALGSVTHALLHCAHSPVAVVRAPGGASGR